MYYVYFVNAEGAVIYERTCGTKEAARQRVAELQRHEDILAAFSTHGKTVKHAYY